MAVSDNQKRARCDLTCDALRYLAENPEVYLTRRLFFAPQADRPSTKEELKASSSPGWQQPVLNRLVGMGILKRDRSDGAVVYAVADHEAAQQMVQDWDDEGLLLTHVVFPSGDGTAEAAGRRALIQPERLDDLAATSSEAGSEQYMERAMDSFHKLVEVSDRNFSEIYSRLGALAEEMGQNRASTEALYQKLAEVHAALGSVEKRVGGNNKRLEDLTERVRDCTRAAEKLRDKCELPDELENIFLNTAANAVETALARSATRSAGLPEVAEVLKEVRAISKAMDDLAQNRLLAAVAILERSLEDQHTLRDIILDAVRVPIDAVRVPIASPERARPKEASEP